MFSFYKRQKKTEESLPPLLPITSTKEEPTMSNISLSDEVIRFEATRSKLSEIEADTEKEKDRANSLESLSLSYSDEVARLRSKSLEYLHHAPSNLENLESSSKYIAEKSNMYLDARRTMVSCWERIASNKFLEAQYAKECSEALLCIVEIVSQIKSKELEVTSESTERVKHAITALEKRLREGEDIECDKVMRLKHKDLKRTRLEEDFAEEQSNLEAEYVSLTNGTPDSSKDEPLPGCKKATRPHSTEQCDGQENGFLFHF